MRYFEKLVCMACIASSLVACGLRKQTSETDTSLKPVGPMFIADSAYQFCQQQCDFGPRTMNSAAHDACGNPAVWYDCHPSGGYPQRL